MFENFTRRHHLDHFETDLQYEYVPPPFRYDLFKLVSEHCRDEEESTIREYVLYRGASIAINSDYYRLYEPDDIMEFYSSDLFVDLLLKSEWHEVLSIIEFLVNGGPLTRKELNKLLEYHRIGYEIERVSDGTCRVVVKYSALIADTERILSSDVPFAPAIEAIKAAKEALIDPKNIDVASSIALSVTAVEAYLRGWFEARSQKAATLGDAVKLLEKYSLCSGHVISHWSTSTSIAIAPRMSAMVPRNSPTSLVRMPFCVMRWLSHSSITSTGRTPPLAESPPQ